MRTYLRDGAEFELLGHVSPKVGTAVSMIDVGAMRTKTVRCKEADMIYVYCYPLLSRAEYSRAREELDSVKKTSSGVQLRKIAKYNNKRRCRDFEMLCNANFGTNDLHVTLTYDRETYYEANRKNVSRDDVKRHMRSFIAKVKRRIKRFGADPQEFRWVMTIVSKEGTRELADGVEPMDTHHVHMLMHGVPVELRTDIERLWEHGFCNADRLQPDGSGLAKVAGYIARQEGSANGCHSKSGEKSYTCSRNIIKPIVKTSDKRISRARAAKVAADVRIAGREIFERVYAGYVCAEQPEVAMTDFVNGVYIRAKLKKREAVRR